MNILKYAASARRTTGCLAAVVLSVSWYGCTDAVVDPVASSGSDPYEVRVLDKGFVDAFSEVPSFESVVAGRGLGKLSTHHDTTHHGNPPADTSTHHEPPADTSDHQPPPDSSHHQPPADTSHHNPPHHPPHHDTTAHDSTRHHAGSAEHWRDLSLQHEISILRPHSYSHAPAELHLSHEQDSLFRAAVAAHSALVNTAYHDYISLRKARLAVLNHELHELHDAMRSGRVSHEQGRDRMHVLVAGYKTDVTSLGAALAAAITAAGESLDTDLRRFLSDEQYTAWLAIKHG